MPQFHGLWQKTGDSLVLDPRHCYDKIRCQHCISSNLTSSSHRVTAEGSGDICIHVHCITWKELRFLMRLTDLVFLEKMLSLSSLLILVKIVQNNDSVWVYKVRDPGKNVSQPSDVGWHKQKPHIYWLLFPSEFPCWEKLSLHITFFPWFLNSLT